MRMKTENTLGISWSGKTIQSGLKAHRIGNTALLGYFGAPSNDLPHRILDIDDRVHGANLCRYFVSRKVQ